MPPCGPSPSSLTNVSCRAGGIKAAGCWVPALAAGSWAARGARTAAWGVCGWNRPGYQGIWADLEPGSERRASGTGTLRGQALLLLSLGPARATLCPGVANVSASPSQASHSGGERFNAPACTQPGPATAKHPAPSQARLPHQTRASCPENGHPGGLIDSGELPWEKVRNWILQLTWSGLCLPLLQRAEPAAGSCAPPGMGGENPEWSLVHQ